MPPAPGREQGHEKRFRALRRGDDRLGWVQPNAHRVSRRWTAIASPRRFTDPSLVFPLTLTPRESTRARRRGFRRMCRCMVRASGPPLSPTLDVATSSPWARTTAAGAAESMSRLPACRLIVGECRLCACSAAPRMASVMALHTASASVPRAAIEGIGRPQPEGAALHQRGCRSAPAWRRTAQWRPAIAPAIGRSSGNGTLCWSPPVPDDLCHHAHGSPRRWPRCPLARRTRARPEAVRAGMPAASEQGRPSPAAASRGPGRGDPLPPGRCPRPDWLESPPV